MSSSNALVTMNVGHYLKLLSGFPFPSHAFSTEEGFPLIRIRDVINSTIGTYYKGSFIPSYVIKKGDVLIGMDGDFNIARWNNEDALLNQRVLKIEVADNSKLDLDFMFYWLQPYIKKINDLTAATTVKHLSTKDIIKAEGDVPCIFSQKKIGKILTVIDQSIEKTEALIEKYKQVKAGLMHDLFTRGITADGKLRPNREQAPDLYQETSIGLIPKEWNLISLNEMADIVSGVTLGSKTSSDQSIEVPYLRVANVQDGYLDLSDIKTIHINKKTLTNLLLQDGDVLMNEGGDFDKLGRGAVWRNEIEPCIHQNHVFRVRTYADVLSPDYLAYWSESNFGKKYFVLNSKQSTNLASINSTQLKAYPVGVPDLFEQVRIKTRLEAVVSKVKSLQIEQGKLVSQKNGLMQDLLTGKVSVSLDEEGGHV